MTTGGLRLTIGAAILSACVVVPATAHADATCTWAETVLPEPQGTAVTDVLSGDPAGRWLVGNSRQDSAVVWHDGAVSRTVPFADKSSAIDVNDDGIVITRSWSSGKAFQHFPDGRTEELPGLPGAAVTSPENINSAGDVVGLSGGQNVASVVVWRADRPGIVERLPLSPNAIIWKVTGIDDDGRVAGFGYTGDGVEGYVWDRDHNRVQLQPLPGHRSAWPQTIRDGRIVGQSAVDGSGDGGQLVEWDLTGQIVRTFGRNGSALSVNASGHVLGFFGAGLRYGVWRSADDYRMLPDVLPSLLTDDDEVVGKRYDGEQRKFVPIRLHCGVTRA